MSFTIKTPNLAFTGVRAGIAIADGQGKTDDVEIARECKSYGYDVQPDPTPSEPTSEKSSKKKKDDK